MTVAPLAGQLDDAARAVLTEPNLDMSHLHDLAARALAEARGADVVQQRALLQAVQRLQAALSTRMKAISARLEKTGKGRRAIRGYGSLRSNSTGQRLFRKV